MYDDWFGIGHETSRSNFFFFFYMGQEKKMVVRDGILDFVRRLEEK